jgi:predicted TIM-barrel fold metal-dependent hydrolase
LLEQEATVAALPQGVNVYAALPNIDINQLKNVLAFLHQGFQYRFINVFDYLRTYNPPNSPGRSIDLMVSNLVDYDWPLAMGRKTRTPFPHQIDIMERLSVFTYGRVHAMAPFDPMREVAEDAGFRAEHGAGPHFPFESITDAVLYRGFVGVKLYPVMGFRPARNAGLPADTWQKAWLPSWMTKPITIGGRTQSFGAWMDAKLERLYQWCEDNDVPITLHADNSQGPDRIFDMFPFDATWADVFSNHPKLRVNFGHAGSPTNISRLYERITPYMQPGNHVYGDLSYPNGALDAPVNLAATLKNILTTQPTDLHDHIMYGTDWLMLLIANNSESCLRIFEQALTLLDQTPHSGISYADRFFAGNAIEFLGLAKGSVSRGRLEVFYRKNGMNLTRKPPDWMSKVDAMYP